MEAFLFRIDETVVKISVGGPEQERIIWTLIDALHANYQEAILVNNTSLADHPAPAGPSDSNE